MSSEHDVMPPARVYLFVPAHRERFVQRALQLGADALVFDLEDSVPPAEKDVALTRAADLIAHLSEPPGQVEIYVRVNGLESGRTQAEVTAVVGPGLSGIRLPKVDYVEQVEAVCAWLTQAELSHGVPAGSVRLDLTIESARGVEAAASLAAADARVRALVFGHADYCRDVGALEGVDGLETLYARSHLVVASRAAGLIGPIDGAHPRLDDGEGLLKSAIAACRLGYSGKSAIHPDQVAPILSAFSPSGQEVEEAQDVVATYEQALDAGVGAARSTTGQLVDTATYLRALAVLRRAVRATGRELRGDE